MRLLHISTTWESLNCAAAALELSRSNSQSFWGGWYAVYPKRIVRAGMLDRISALKHIFHQNSSDRGQSRKNRIQ